MLTATRTVGSFYVVWKWSLACVPRRACTPCVNKTPKFYFQTETSQLVPVVVESVSCLFLLSLFCLISLFHVVTCFQTVAVKSIFISVIVCNDFMMSTEFRLQWWVGGFVTHLRVACCTHPPTTATSHSLSPKWAGLTIPHLSVDKKGLRLFIRCACQFQSFPA